MSSYAIFRDRMCVRATCKFYPAHPDYDKAHLRIRVVNRGRRIAILTLFGGDLDDGSWSGEGFGESGKGARLAEQECYEIRFYKSDILAELPDRESNYIELWFEDSLGRRHRVRNSKKNIRLLKES